MSLQQTAVISTVAVTLSAPVGAQTGTTQNPFITDVRATSAVDLNGDGYKDIFLHPSHFLYGPALAPVVLLNDGRGGFYDGTASIFSKMPTIAQTNGVFFRDYNNDDRVDLFVVDQGLEIGDAYATGFKGAQNQLYLQDQNGVFQDATSFLPNNGAAFNHLSSVADINGDGNLDFVITRLGGPAVEGSGTFLYLGDGKGSFTYSTTGLPSEIKYETKVAERWNSKTIDYQYSGSNAVADLNGDGRMDMVMGSYRDGDQLSGKQTLRVFQQDSSGQFTQKWQSVLPDALAKEGINGAAGIVAGDIDGDGRQDFVVQWENGGATGLQILHNLGNWQFADVTSDWLGSYLIRKRGIQDSNGDFAWPSMLPNLKDVNHDGALDLVLTTQNISPTQFSNSAPLATFLYLNDGAGHFKSFNPAVSAAALVAETNSTSWALGTPLIFDANNDGKEDVVFLDSEKYQNPAVSSNSITLQVATLSGIDSAGVYRATDLGDNLSGSAGNDQFINGRGRDSIDGGAGIDSLIYASLRSNVSLALNSKGFTVTSKAKDEGIDTLLNIERIQFSDVTVNLTAGVKALTIAPLELKTLEELYVAFFNRVPDADGLLYWIDQFKQGMSLNTIAENFYGAAVQYSGLTNYSPTMSNDDFVKVIYKNVLGRSGATAPDGAEVGYWSGELSSGRATKGSLVSSMLTSAHSFKGNQTWGWVADLLDNKVSVATYFAVEQGLNYNSPEDSISKGMAIAAAVTSMNTANAISLVGIVDVSFSLA